MYVKFVAFSAPDNTKNNMYLEHVFQQGCKIITFEVHKFFFFYFMAPKYPMHVLKKGG
jgi:hypothetical protein